MLDTLNSLDHELMLWFNYDGGAFQDAFWYALSMIPSWIPLYLVIIAIMWRGTAQGSNFKLKHWQAFLTLLLFTALIFAFTDHISAGIIKPLVARPRPSHEPSLMEQLHFVRDYHGGAYGFVSSHAANCFGLAVWVSLLFRQRHLVWAMGLYAVLNCYSRIYLGVHYPGDILCGTLLGILCGWIGYICYTHFCCRLKINSITVANPLPITLAFWLTILAFIIYATFCCLT